MDCHRSVPDSERHSFDWLFCNNQQGWNFPDEKLIYFFQQYGKGQLIFTTHNIESMNVLKNQSRSIVVLGVDNNLDTWTPKGNRSPINSYYSGGFLHSPMNVEDFDFINIFLGE